MGVDIYAELWFGCVLNESDLLISGVSGCRECNTPATGNYCSDCGSRISSLRAETPLCHEIFHYCGYHHWNDLYDNPLGTGIMLEHDQGSDTYYFGYRLARTESSRAPEGHHVTYPVDRIDLQSWQTDIRHEIPSLPTLEFIVRLNQS